MADPKDDHHTKNSNDPPEQVCFKTPFNNTCTDVMITRGWTRISENEPHQLHWCDVSWLRDNFDNSYLPENLKICHFRNHYELTRKNLMVKNLKRLKKLIKKSGGTDTLDFYPTTYELPMEYHIFVEEFKRTRQEYETKLLVQKHDQHSHHHQKQEPNIPTWIMKPVGRAQGRGIFLFRRLKDIQDWRRITQDSSSRTVNPGYTHLINSNVASAGMTVGLDQKSKDNLDHDGAGGLDPDGGSIHTHHGHASHLGTSGPTGGPSSGSITTNHNTDRERERDREREITQTNSLASKASENQTAFVVENYVVSRYIDNPYLITGKKFDIRMYVLVTSFSPLVVWMHREGFARFSNQRFSLENIDNAIVHLTNVAIQKQAADYDPDKGAKWSLESLRTYLSHKHGVEKINEVFNQMSRIVIRSLQSVKKTIISDKHCFELYGYDLMLDENLKLWLIEINSSPSLAASSFEDYELKFGLLWDTFDVIDLEKKRSKKEFRVGGYDLIWNEDESFFSGNPFYPSASKSNSSGKIPPTAGQSSSFKNSKLARENKAENEAISLLSNHSIHADPLVHNSQFFKNLPSYPTNNYCGCSFDRQRVVLEE